MVSKVYMASSCNFFQSLVLAGAADLRTPAGEARTLGRDIDDISAAVGARRRIFLFWSESIGRAGLVNGGFNKPNLGVIINFW